MPIEMDIKMTGFQRVRSRMKRMFSSLNNPRPLFEDETRTLQQIFRERFMSRGGGSWAPISSATEKISGPHEPLMDKKELFNSLTGRNKFTIRQISGKTLKFGTSHPGADPNDKGAVISVTDSTRKFFAAHGIYLRDDTSTLKIPKRAFFFLSTRDDKKIFITWRSWASSIVRRNSDR